MRAKKRNSWVGGVHAYKRRLRRGAVAEGQRVGADGTSGPVGLAAGDPLGAAGQRPARQRALEVAAGDELVGARVAPLQERLGEACLLAPPVLISAARAGAASQVISIRLAMASAVASEKRCDRYGRIPRVSAGNENTRASVRVLAAELSRCARPLALRPHLAVSLPFSD